MQKAKNMGFLLTNRNGGYAFLSNKPMSRFGGVHFFDGNTIRKVIDDIRISGDIEKINNRLWQVEAARQGNKINYFMPHNFNSFVIESGNPVEFDLILDVRDPYDIRQKGRSHEFYEEDGALIIKYTKKTGSGEDRSDGKEEYRIFIAVKGNHIKGKLNRRWEKQHYPIDCQRNSIPYDMPVFNAASIRAKRVVFSFSKDKREALRESNYVYENLTKLKKKHAEHAKHLVGPHIASISRIDSAYKCAVNSLDSLTVNGDSTTGIYAGLPFYFQSWSRDELVCLRALMIIGQLGKVKDIIMKYLKSICPDGRLPNRDPKSELGSADSIGWLFRRTGEYIKLLRSTGMLSRYLAQKDILFIEERLHHSVCLLEKYRMRKGLVRNSARETWMDSYPKDLRGGSRIEIQALQLSMYKLLHELTGDDVYMKDENLLRKRVRKIFWDSRKGYLKDGADDPAVRPNIFIAAYIYPGLLEKDEWVRCFNYALKRLWLPWGGLSSVDKSDPMYCSSSTGEDWRSYHHGDSWFWINNLAAIVMHRTDRAGFRDRIKSIVDASTREILYSGTAGHHAEISSAGKFSSRGCQAQAWSAAMYIELVNELY